MALPKPVIRTVRAVFRWPVSLFHRLAFGYGRHDAGLDARFYVPIHRSDAELRGLLLPGGAR